MLHFLRETGKWIALTVSVAFFLAVISIAQAAQASVCYPANGCTGTSTTPSYGQLLIGGHNSEYELTSTSSLGLLTTNVAEGTNLYFTNARAISALTGQNISIFANNAGYLTGNQSITLSGDVTGSGATSITTAFNLANPHWWAATQNFTQASSSQFTASSTAYLQGLTNFGSSNQSSISASGVLTLGTALAVSSGGTGLTSTSQNFFFAGPTSGSGAPSWRAIVAGDIPTLNQNTTGQAGSVANSLSPNSTLNGSSFNGSSAVSNWGLNLGNSNIWTAFQNLTGAASSSMFSLNVGPLYVGGTSATSTIQGQTTGTSTLQGFLNVSGSNSTSTFTGGIQVSNIYETGSASSTYTNGINIISGGCFAINGTCVGGGGGGSGTVTSVTLATPNSTLTVGGTNPVTTSGTINADLNLTHSNIWAALQVFSANSTSSELSAYQAFFGGTATDTIATNGTLTLQDADNSWSGITTPTRYLTLETSSSSWAAATNTGPYVPSTVAPFAGTVKNIKCLASSTAAFLGITAFIGSTNMTPSYFVASNTVGTITLTGNNTFTAGQQIGLYAGTGTAATANQSVQCTFSILQTS
jgi:hypothetical protein